MGQKENEIKKEIILNQKFNERLWRINCGMAWIGNCIWNKDGSVTIKNPRAFHGLPTGFSDIIGLESIIITQDMVNKRVAIFKAIEIKTGKLKLTEEQNLFKNMILNFGGIFEEIRGD